MRYTFMPAGIRDLPFNSLRSKLYPPNPVTSGQAAQWQVEGHQPAIGLMPQLSLFTKWQVPHPQAPGAAAYGAIEAGRYHVRRIMAMAQVGVRQAPTMSWQQAAAPFNQLPAPRPQINLFPLSRGIPDHASLSAQQLQVLGASGRTVGPTHTPVMQTINPLQMVGRFRVQVY